MYNFICSNSYSIQYSCISCTLFKKKSLPLPAKSIFNLSGIGSLAPHLHLFTWPASLEVSQSGTDLMGSHTPGREVNIIIQTSLCIKKDAYTYIYIYIHMYKYMIFFWLFPRFFFGSFSYLFIVFYLAKDAFFFPKNFPGLRVIVCPGWSAGTILQDILRTILVDG